MYGAGKEPRGLISLRSAKGKHGESCMTLERITEKNIDYAIQIQEELFPGESGRANFVESMDESSGYEYFLLYEDGTCVGVIGIYSYPEDQYSAWLG